MHKNTTFLFPIVDLKENTQRYYEIYSIFSLIYTAAEAMGANRIHSNGGQSENILTNIQAI
jgi:hypothetical protein